MDLVLAVDVGTTNLKAAVISPTGQILRTAKEELTLERDNIGAAEHDPDKLWDSFIRVSREALSSFQERNVLLVFSSYHWGLIFLDKSMRPITRMSTFPDTRAQTTFFEFRKLFDPVKFYNLAGSPPLSQGIPARIFYLNKEDPNLLKNTSYALSSKSYLLYKLTGEILTDPSTEAASQLMGVKSRNWEPEILSAINLQRSVLPTIVKALEGPIKITDNVKKALALRGELWTIPGVYDCGAMSIALGAITPAVGIINLGTSSMLRISADKPIFDQSEKMQIQSYYLTDGIYLVGAGVNNGALVLKWIAERICAIESGSSLNDELDNISKDYPLLLPFITGERDPNYGDVASGVFYGLKAHHGRADLLAAAIDGISFPLGSIYSTLNNNNLTANQIRAGGGGANIERWAQTISAVIEMDIYTTPYDELGCLGNAVLGYSVINNEPINTTYSNLMPPYRRVEMDEDRVNQVKDRYPKWISLLKSIEPLFRII